MGAHSDSEATTGDPPTRALALTDATALADWLRAQLTPPLVATTTPIAPDPPTARIAAELSDMGGENIGETALRGAAFPHSIPFRVAAAAMKKRAQGISNNVADELSKRMLMSPDQVMQYSPTLEKKAVQVAKSRLRNRIAQRVLANKAGSAAGGLGSGP